MIGEAATRIEEMTEQNRQSVDLARLLSFAVPIEPALVRAMRIELLPQVDVSAEADLWFGPLVQTRSRDGIMLLPEVAETLRAGLNEKLAERCWRITERLHDYLPPAVQLEEKLNFLSINPAANAVEIDKLVQSALTALIGQSREEIANWAGRALPRLSQAVRATEGAAMLAAASDLRLGRGFTLAEHLSGGAIPGWFGAVLPTGLGTTSLGVSATSVGLMLDPAAGSQAPRITLPVTDPRVVQISAGGETKVVFIDAKGAAQHVPIAFEAGPIELTTLAGEAFRLDRVAGVVASDHRLACAAYANCNQALIVWQIGAPIERCLGFALERIDATGQSEFLKNGVGFPGNRSESTLQPSTMWPFQRFRWIDRPPRRGTGAIYSYRITPVVGVPPKLELVKELEAVTAPVEVGVTRQGPITALFNREPGAPQSLPETVEAGSGLAAREELGGEVRRALLRLLHDALVDRISTVYVALGTLDDDELIKALADFGSRANIILAGPPAAANKQRLVTVRKTLSGTAFYLRSKGGGLTNVRFMVVCGADGAPQTVWTGSVAWSSGVLYGKDANALIIEDAAIAARYLAEWQLLREDPSRARIATANEKPALFQQSDGTQVRSWFAPVRNGADLADVRRYVASARSAILFAVGPRTRTSVVDDILRLSGSRYVAGVARPVDGAKQVVVYEHGEQLVVTPQRLPSSVFSRAGLKAYAVSLPIGSRLIVVDPLSDNPVVITGSYTFNAVASSRNDDDLLIIEGNRALAQQCAVHIKGLIDHYAFRGRANASRARLNVVLRPDESWQRRFMTGERAREIRFWMGTLGEVHSVPLGAEASDLAPRSKRPPSAKKAATKKASTKKASTKKASTKKASTKKARSSAKAPGGSGFVGSSQGGTKSTFRKTAKKTAKKKTSAQNLPKPAKKKKAKKK